MKEHTGPLYLQISEDIKRKIHNGEYQVNTKIPTEAELEKIYGASRITIRKALELLVEDEILSRKPKIGTYVTAKKITRSLNQSMSFSKTCERNGHVVSTVLLSAELREAKERDIQSLELEGETHILVIRRLRFCDGVPVIVEENRFAKKYAFLLAEDLSTSLYAILEKHGVYPEMSRKTIGVCYGTKEEAACLGVSEGSALLLTRDVAYGRDNKPIYRGKEVVNAEKFEYTILQRNHE